MFIQLCLNCLVSVVSLEKKTFSSSSSSQTSFLNRIFFCIQPSSCLSHHMYEDEKNNEKYWEFIGMTVFMFFIYTYMCVFFLGIKKSMNIDKKLVSCCCLPHKSDYRVILINLFWMDGDYYWNCLLLMLTICLWWIPGNLRKSTDWAFECQRSKSKAF